MRRRDIIITACAVVTAAALVIAGMVIFSGGRHRAAAPKPPAAHAGLTSPFTGEPVTTLGPVLAVKIDNIEQARPQTGLTAQGQPMTFARGPVWVVLAARP
jgi:hypothetical protein